MVKGLQLVARIHRFPYTDRVHLPGIHGVRVWPIICFRCLDTVWLNRAYMDLKKGVQTRLGNKRFSLHHKTRRSVCQQVFWCLAQIFGGQNFARSLEIKALSVPDYLLL